MSDSRTLHAKRLEKSLDTCLQLRAQGVSSWTPDFRDWRETTIQSLGVLFGPNHPYSQRFKGLRFDEKRTDLDDDLWGDQNRNTFEEDFQRAEKMLRDAIEELPISAQPAPPKGPAKGAPPVVVNVYNTLSQSATVSLSQVISGLGSLGLDDQGRELATKYANDLVDESSGPQRWPVLAKSLEALKAMGKAVYEQVAIPLLLELIKKQIGQ